MSLPAIQSTQPSRTRGRRRAPRRRNPLFTALAGTLAVLLGVGTVVGLSIAERAEAAGTLVVTTEATASEDVAGDAFVVAGDTFDLTLTMRNTSDPASDLYNAAFVTRVPSGLEFVGGGSLLGSPRIIVGPDAATALTEGEELWIWEDIADLPAGAALSDTVKVRPAQPEIGTGETDVTTVFPVGSTVTTVTSAYASDQARLLPVFAGSTGAATDPGHNASGNQATNNVPVQAIDVEKSEPSPENELVRGVQDEHTTYTISVRNTSQGPTDNVVVVDYLPAGLEYIGGGEAPVRADEYEGSGPIGGVEPENYVVATTVETVSIGEDDPSGLTAGVYTKVTWNLGTLAADETVVIDYLAAVPLYENTMNFAGGTPDTGGAQAANLDNNNGPSTREGTTDPANPADGQSLRNLAAATGLYQGVVRTGADRTTEDSADVIVTAEDLAITKTAPNALFSVGDTATYTLTLRTGEYAAASDIVGVDVLPDGLYPIMPASLIDDPAFATIPVQVREQWFTGSDDVIGGAVITGIEYDPAVDGSVRLTFEPRDSEGNTLELASSSEHPITYSVGMRADYEWNGNARGQTSAGDTFTNTVEITGTTTSIPGITGEAAGVRYVTDESSATMESRHSAVTKEVLRRDALTGFTADGVPTFDSDDDFVDGTTVVPNGFVVGDTAVYRLRVPFPAGIDTRNPVIVDMLPAGITYGGWAYGPGATLDLSEQIEPTVEVDRIRWTPGVFHEPSGDRFVLAGRTFEVLVWGTVDSISDGSASTQEDALDKPENLVKYRYENVDGEVFFSRDQASILVEPGLSLLKGVRSVVDNFNVRSSDRPANTFIQNSTDGDDFNSNRDEIRVVQGEKVTYRIDITAPQYDTENVLVWDALPDGITAAGDFALEINGAPATLGSTPSVVDSSDYPAGVSTGVTGSLLVWTIDELAASSQVTLLYTVTIPQGTIIDTEFDNTASIIRYDAVSNVVATPNVTIVPDGPLSTTPPATGEYRADGTHATDESNVYLPNAEIGKERISTELTDAANSAGQAVAGEYITYQYTLTVPAHTSIPAGSSLWDEGQLGVDDEKLSDYTLADETLVGDNVEMIASPAGFTGFTLNQNGLLTFDSQFDNDSDDPAEFTVQIIVYTDGLYSTDNKFDDGDTLYNRALFQKGEDGPVITDTATVQYREIAPQLAKTVEGATDVQVVADQDVTYVLTASNPADRPSSHDTVVIDCVPSELLLQDASTFVASQGTVVTPLGTCADGVQITWNVGTLAPGASATLTYIAKVDPASAGRAVYTNTADLTGTTVPGVRDGEATEGDDATATVRVQPATLEKSVSPGSGTIGDIFDYEVELTLPADVNFYDAVINDTLPSGLEVVAGTVHIDSTDAALTFIPTSAHNGTTVLEWTLEDGSATPVESADIERTVTLTYQARMVEYGTGGTLPVRGNSLTNAVAFGWSIAPGGTPATPVTDTATVTVTEPTLAITKKVNGLDEDRVELDETFDYTVTVTNTGNAEAHNMVVTDTVPTGVIVDAATIPDGGVLSGADATTGGGIITWNLAGPLAPGAANAIELTYEATLAASEHLNPAAQTPAGWWTNTAAVTHYESHPTDGRDYNPTNLTDTARVMPLFPFVELGKTVGAQGSIAYIDESFQWQLTLRNTGPGAAQTVTAVDTLPENWEYDAGSAMVSIAGAAPVSLADPTISGQALTWTFGEANSADPILAGAVGSTTQAIVITFTATPRDGVITSPGIGAGIDHTNTLTAGVTDVTDSPENGGGGYVGPDAEDDAQIHVADLSLVKTGATDAIVAGSGATTGWTIQVTNDGPNPAVGPFLVEDVTDALPAGVSITGYTGSGWSLVSQQTVDGVVTGVYSYGDADTTLASGSSLPALGLTVTVAADFDPADLPTGQIGNRAEVTSPAHDDDPTNNGDEDPVHITTAADLVIDKAVTSSSPTAGASITWTITVTNDGPSVSRSSTDAPITVTDVIPPGVTNVTMATVPSGWNSNIPAGGSLTAGDTLTLTHSGAPLGVGAAVIFTLDADVLSSHLTGSITNTAEVEPGETPDPDPSNNDDEEETPVGTDTTLGVSKIRVVQDSAGDWVPATDPIVAGETVTYRIVVSNNGPADATGVTITDTLTEGLEAPVTHTSLLGTWTAGTSTATVYEFDLDGDLVPGASASLLVTATAVAGLTEDDSVINHVRATATNDPDGPEDQDTGGPVRVADLTIAKSHDPAAEPAVAGETLDYTIVVTNLGPSYATGPIVVTDTLPVGFGYQAGSATVGGVAHEPAVDGQTLTWTIGDGDYSLANGDTITISLTTTIASDVTAGDYENTATVSSPDDDNPANNTTTDEVPVVTSTDVTIVKAVASAAPHVAGGSVTYTLTVQNHGPSVARSVTVTDVPDAGLTITAMSGTGWDCTVATAVCAFDGDLPVGTSTIQVTADIASWVPDSTVLNNEATVRWSDSDGPHEHEDDEPITVTAIADLSIVKSLASDTLDAGETGRYRIDVSNHADASDAVDVTVTDTLPIGLTYVGGLTSGGNAWTLQGVDGDGYPTFALTGTLPAGASTWLEFDVAVDEAVTGDVTNVATARSPIDPEEPTDDETTTVGTTTNLVIVKERSGTPGDARIGDTTEFLITVTNEGPATATGVTVTDALPTGLTFADVATPATGDGWTFSVNGDELTASLDTALPTGETVSFTVTALVQVAAYPAVSNTATVEGDNPETTEEDNTSTTEVPVAPQVDLGIVKELVSDELIVGETATYRLTVTNNGPTEDPGPITVRDELPDGLKFVESDNDACGAVENVFECQITDTLAVGDSITIDLTVEVTAAAYPSVTNTATVNTESEDTDPENNTSTVTHEATPDVRFTIEKTVASSDDDTITWQVTVSSVGLNDAIDGVEVTDTLPAELTYVSSSSADGFECLPAEDDTTGRTLVCDHPEVLPTGESASFLIVTTTTQEYGTSVTNHAQVTGGFIIEPDEPVQDTANYMRALPWTGGAPGFGLALLALLALVGGSLLMVRTRRQTMG